MNNPSSDVSSSVRVVPTTISPSSNIVVDPFQTPDLFASRSDTDRTAANNIWFQSINNEHLSTTVDPFLPKPKSTESLPIVTSPRIKKAAPKANANLKSLISFPIFIDKLPSFLQIHKKRHQLLIHGED